MEFTARTDLALRRQQLADRGWTQLPGVLGAGDAESLHTTLAQGVDWRFVLNHQNRHHDVHPLQVAAIDASAREAIATGVVAGAQQGFQYAYDNYPVGDIAAGGGSLPALIAGAHELIVGGPFVAFARDVTGDARIASADLQATRYRPGHFLTTHDDSLQGKHRLYAYVLGLTKNWRPAYGGLLLFHDSEGQIQCGLTPGFNVLNIFRVPHPHSVSQVATFAPAFRYSLTGWLKSAARPDPARVASHHAGAARGPACGTPRGAATVECSVDLQLSTTTVTVDDAGWQYAGRRFPWFDECRDRTIYYWDGAVFRPVSRYTSSLVKLIPTVWGPPTFEIDGIKMLPTEKVSPWEDAARKVGLIRPRGKVVLDTCGGLGYFAAWCLEGAVRQVQSFEKIDVLWLRRLNPWSPEASATPTAALSVTLADISEAIVQLPDESVDVILHDPPRFGVAGELYSADFYAQMFRVVRPRGLLFHYTGTPNRLTTGRDVPREVARRLDQCGFATERVGDGVLAVKKPNAPLRARSA